MKRRSKVHEKNISRECALKSYKPKRVWLWLVYKISKNNCHL